MPVVIPTFADLQAAARAEVQSRNPDIDDWEAGSVADALTGSGAVLADESIRAALAAMGRSYLGTARREDLDARIQDYGGPPRLAPSAATTVLLLTRDSYVGPYTVTAGDPASGRAIDGSTVIFTVTETTTLLADDDEVEVPVVCTVTGRAGNVPSGTLTLDGLPDGLVSSQPQRAAGGSDGEPYTDAGDQAYRARYLLARSGGGNGRIQDLRAAALGVEGVQFVAVDEDFIHVESGGYVAIYVGDPDAEASPQLVEAVERAIGRLGDETSVRAGGVEVRVIASERELVSDTMTVIVSSDSGITEAAVVAAYVAYHQTLDPGETRYASQLEAFIHKALDPRTEDRVLSVTVSGARELAPALPHRALRVLEDGSGLTLDLQER